MNEFPSPHERIRRVLDSALSSGSTYLDSQDEANGGTYTLRARRGDGREVGVRFRGVSNGMEAAGPDSGLPLTVRDVKRVSGSVLSRLFPLLKPPGQAYARVRIEVGAAVLEIVCQDAEWWEE